MTITTFSELREAILEVIEDESAEVDAFIDKAVFIAEERVIKDLDMQTFVNETFSDTFTTASAIGGGVETKVSTCILDTNFMFFNDVFYCNRKLDHQAYSFTKEINRHETSAGTSARYYSFNNDPAVIYVAPPVSGGNFEIRYTKRPDHLSNVTTTSDLIKKAPDLLYYACLVEMSLFLKNWETLPIWRDMYSSALESHLNTTRRERTDEGLAHGGPSNTQSTTGIQ